MKARSIQSGRFAAFCREHGLSVTHQRLAIFEALACSREHPSAEQLHKAVQRRIPTLSLATVYKNLEALKAIGAVADVNSLHEEARYEAALPGTGAGRPHHHLVCVECHRILDLHDSGLDGLRLRDAQGFAVRAVRVQAEGLCPDCQRRTRKAAPRRAGAHRSPEPR
ncbi:MAG TPA: Fur family transcriptional regulator [Myxococcales bacterium]|nr:Fur family transcriptional regulator [Myxococcales bacterium]